MPEGKSEIVPDDVIAAGNRFADLFGDGRQGYVAFDIAVLAIMEERQRAANVASHFMGSLWSSDQNHVASLIFNEIANPPSTEENLQHD